MVMCDGGKSRAKAYASSFPAHARPSHSPTPLLEPMASFQESLHLTFRVQMMTASIPFKSYSILESQTRTFSPLQTLILEICFFPPEKKLHEVLNDAIVPSFYPLLSFASQKHQKDAMAPPRHRSSRLPSCRIIPVIFFLFKELAFGFLHVRH